VAKRLNNQEWINAVRTQELHAILRRYGTLLEGKDLLEIGSGAGAQLLVLAQICKSAIGIETTFRSDRLSKVIDYDGRNIPFPDASFDVVFSSHAMEHVADEKALHKDIHRVLRPNGVCLHVVPTAAWRFYTSVLYHPTILRNVARRLRGSGNDTSMYAVGKPSLDTRSLWRSRFRYVFTQSRHGEAGNWFTEHFLFRTAAWRKRFTRLGWIVADTRPEEFFQSGHYFLNERISWSARQRLSRMLGPTGMLFVMRSSHCTAGVKPTIQTEPL
jgi:SAM-dependent methyltransferase